MYLADLYFVRKMRLFTDYSYKMFTAIRKMRLYTDELRWLTVINGNVQNKAGIANDKQMVQWTFAASGALGPSSVACFELSASVYADTVLLNQFYLNNCTPYASLRRNSHKVS